MYDDILLTKSILFHLFRLTQNKPTNHPTNHQLILNFYFKRRKKNGKTAKQKKFHLNGCDCVNAKWEYMKPYNTP